MDAFNNKLTKTFCIIAAVLMLAILVLQLLPFWTVDDEVLSMDGYIWWVEKYGGVTSEFKGIMENLGYEWDINWLVLWPIMQTITALVGIALHIKAHGNGFMLLFPIACGMCGILGFTRHPLLQMGSTWVIQLIISIAMIVVAVVGLVLMYKQYSDASRALQAKIDEARALEAK